MSEIIEMSNAEYHAESLHLSSSSLKLLLTDLEKFYNEKILRIKQPEKDSPHFAEGSFLHSLILEPESVANEYAFFEGWRKQGADWEAFKEANKGKTLLSKPQTKKVEQLFSYYQANQMAKDLLVGCEVEKSLFCELEGIKVKVRADAINAEKGYIVDVKTTSFDLDSAAFKATCDRFHYQLSAALYLKCFEQHYGREFDFYFIVVGKEDRGCKVYRLSKDSRDTGNMQIAKAIKIYKTCLEKNIWTIESKYASIEQEEIEEV